MQAPWITAVRAFPAIRRGSGKPGTRLPYPSLGILGSTVPAPVPAAAAVALRRTFRARLAPAGTGQLADLRRHAAVGGGADQPAHRLGVRNRLDLPPRADGSPVRLASRPDPTDTVDDRRAAVRAPAGAGRARDRPRHRRAAPPGGAGSDARARRHRRGPGFARMTARRHLTVRATGRGVGRLPPMSAGVARERASLPGRWSAADRWSLPDAALHAAPPGSPGRPAAGAVLRRARPGPVPAPRGAPAPVTDTAPPRAAQARTGRDHATPAAAVGPEERIARDDTVGPRPSAPCCAAPGPDRCRPRAELPRP
jgi:hypothetical protein